MDCGFTANRGQELGRIDSAERERSQSTFGSHESVNRTVGAVTRQRKPALRNEAGSSGSDPRRDLIISDESVVEK